MSTGSLVRTLTSSDQSRWLRLWAGYLDFYEKSALPQRVSDNTWTMLIDDRDDVFGLVVEDGGEVVGFVNCVVHPNTWTDRPICYLEDLYVSAEQRGKGHGIALIQAVVDRAKTENWGRVYWRTEHDNTDAQAVYDKITPQGPWVMYQIDL